MAIFGIGAHHESDVSASFFEDRCACVGWDEDDAPPAHALLRHLRTGDILYLKSFNPTVGLTIKAVGIVTEGKVRTYDRLSAKGVPVRWVRTGLDVRVGKLDDKWPVRGVTIFEEFHPLVQSKVLDLLLGPAD